MRSKILIAGMLLLPLAFVAAVCGNETTRIENTGGDEIRGITVAGEGKVTAEPDLAMITLGVSALRPTVAEARERLFAMIREAAVKPVPRRATKPTKASKVKRVEGKKIRSNIKKMRGKSFDD